MKKKIIALFDLDGTLTPPRKPATSEITDVLRQLHSHISLAVVSGSDHIKLVEQLGPAADGIFDYLFAENGVVAYKNNTLFHTQSIADTLGEDYLKKLINFVLKYFSELDLPIKRGTFIEYRCGMLNLCPIGRSCSYTERLNFNEYDKAHKVREKMIAILEQNFGDRLQFALGGQISVDCFPKGQDKRYCLQFIENEFDEIHFFGDKTFPGGNDHEIYEDERTIGHSVSSPEETISLLKHLFS